MKQFTLFILLFTTICSQAQDVIRLSGYVEDQQTGERLTGATIYDQATGKGTSSNAYGFFSLGLPGGNHEIQLGFVGYKQSVVHLNLQLDTLITVSLKPGVQLNEVEVKGNNLNEQHRELSDLSFNRLDLSRIEKLPVILGERDVLKAIQYLPGVKGGRENTSAFNVRGGSSDQNLILLDGVPVYNVYHVFGFFSTFNNDAIKSASFYKGGIPARFGGRLSSVLDITMKEGNMKKSSGVFSISPVSGRFSIEAPIKKDTASYLISFRRSFLDLPMLLMEKMSGSAQKYGFFFYDFNGKANWIVDPKNRLYLSIYSGRDRQFYRSKDEQVLNKDHYQWGNFTSVFRWNRLMSPKLFANFSAYFSQYHYDQKGRSESGETFNIFQSSSNLWDYSVKADFDYFPVSFYTLRFGAKAGHLVFKPNILQIKGEEYDMSFNKKYSNQSDQFELYAENELKLKALSLNAGLRFSDYLSDNKQYVHIEPRLAIGLGLGKGYNLNATYMMTTQYLHLLTNSSLGMPTDLWVASTGKVRPETGQQASLGIEKQFNPTYKLGVEAYYKFMDHVIRFEEGESFINANDNNWEESILVGQGRAYGSEFFLQKVQGRLTGSVSYTLSWAERSFNEINEGRWFPFKYDRRHDVSVVGQYLLKTTPYREKSLSFGFTFQTGNHLSIADTEMPGLIPPGMENYAAPELPDWFSTRKTFNEPNNFKMPAFHHFDLGYSTQIKRSDGKSYTWAFSIYNLYNRMNPWYYYKKEGKVRSVSIFPVIPSVSFTYRW